MREPYGRTVSLAPPSRCQRMTDIGRKRIQITMVVIGPRTACGWLGLIPLVTGPVGTGPLYAVFGPSTFPLQARPN